MNKQKIQQSNVVDNECKYKKNKGKKKLGVVRG